ncbi:metal cation transporter protein, partial [Marine Group I thaumarchaeote SCGC AAA799-P11]
GIGLHNFGEGLAIGAAVGMGSGIYRIKSRKKSV